jgi:hypothetical protein
MARPFTRRAKKSERSVRPDRMAQAIILPWLALLTDSKATFSQTSGPSSSAEVTRASSSSRIAWACASMTASTSPS